MHAVCPVGQVLELPLGSKRAVTDSALKRLTVHVGVVLVHAPAQPAKTEPTSGVAVSVTVVPAGNAPVQVVPQLMPPGTEETNPSPVPDFWTASENGGVATQMPP